MTNSIDEKFMRIALDEAREGYERGDFPVGAVLTFDNIYRNKGNNSTRTNNEWSSHAEASLIRAHAPAIQMAVKEGQLVTLYTTLEPCFMCLGTSVLNRIGRIVYACPDPNGGAAGINPLSLSNWYKEHWPKIDSGMFKEESYFLLVDYMAKNKKWKNVLKIFEEIPKDW